jgi:glycerol transport system ATP-binding protein
MARIELSGVAHAYGHNPASEEAYALKPLEIVWEDAGAYALLGPSGCGKTTLLNIMSGLVTPTRGKVIVGGVDVTRARPEQRNIAQVFQFPVIYDTMSVFDNLAFPLRNRRVPAALARRRVEEVAALLELTGDLPRRASGLSADMKQRVSLGRGLVRKDVAAILLDEPLTVIDPHVKWLLRRKLKQIHEELRVTLVYVTHDQVEALTLADQVVVMKDGRVVQQGSPQELFERPAHTFVGYFIGSPGMNLLPCAIDGGAAVVEGQRVALDPALAARAKARGEALVLGIRPEFVRRATDGAPSALRAEVAEVEDLGRHVLVTARLGRQDIKVRLAEGARVTPGEALWLSFPEARVTLYVGDRAIP